MKRKCLSCLSNSWKVFFPAKVSRDEIKKEKCMVVYEHWLADEGR